MGERITFRGLVQQVCATVADMEPHLFTPGVGAYDDVANLIGEYLNQDLSDLVAILGLHEEANGGDVAEEIERLRSIAANEGAELRPLPGGVGPDGRPHLGSATGANE